MWRCKTTAQRNGAGETVEEQNCKAGDDADDVDLGAASDEPDHESVHWFEVVRWQQPMKIVELHEERPDGRPGDKVQILMASL